MIYSENWFDIITEYSAEEQEEIIFNFSKNEEFIADKKDFLFEKTNDINKNKRTLAMQLLIMYFPDACHLELCLEASQFQNIAVKRSGIKLLILRFPVNCNEKLCLQARNSDNSDIRKKAISLLDSMDYYWSHRSSQYLKKFT
jgi:hypothetical protein